MKLRFTVATTQTTTHPEGGVVIVARFKVWRTGEY